MGGRMKRHCLLCRKGQAAKAKMVRGLCPHCYLKLYAQVRNGIETWDTLMQKGACLSGDWTRNNPAPFRVRLGAAPFRKILNELIVRLECGSPVDDLLPRAKQLLGTK